MIVENLSYSRDPRVSKEARALLEHGYVVSVISPMSGRMLSSRSIDGVQVFGFPLIVFWNGASGHLAEYVYATFAITFITFWLWLTRGFDIIHVANPPDCLVPAMVAYKFIGKRLIYDQHDLCPELYEAKYSSKSAFLKQIQIALEKISYKLADHVIVTNKSYKQIAMGRGGVPESKVTIVRNGPLRAQLRQPEIDAELRKKCKNLMVFAGVTGYQDGLDDLCRALQSLRFEMHREDFLCVVIGDGDAMGYIRRYARELSIEDRMWFTGWISDPVQYRRYLGTADICVAPEPANSYNDRSTFVKIMEYMAAGKAIVAFDLPENRFSADCAAIYAKPNSSLEFAEKLAMLMDNEAQRLEMGKSGRERIETKLAWEYSIPELMKVYGDVANC